MAQSRENEMNRLVAAPWTEATGTLEGRAAELLRSGEAAVLATILQSEGSAPRHAGTRALQTRKGFEGTVGGGVLEAEAMRIARDCLGNGRSSRRAFAMDAASPDTDMVCGGRMDLLCEFLRPEQAAVFALADETLARGGRGLWVVTITGDGDAARPERRLYVEGAEGPLPEGATAGLDAALPLSARTKNRPGLLAEGGLARYVEPLDAPPVLLLCGGGHVALETARLARQCGFVVDVADDREDFASAERFPMARNRFVLPGFAGLAACGIGPRHYVAIMTRGHAFDREVLAQALETPARYIGMIGSKSKRAHVYALLEKAGVAPERLVAVRCPIGLPVLAETPRQIAVSIVAELLAERSGTLDALREGR